MRRLGQGEFFRIKLRSVLPQRELGHGHPPGWLSGLTFSKKTSPLPSCVLTTRFWGDGVKEESSVPSSALSPFFLFGEPHLDSPFLPLRLRCSRAREGKAAVHEMEKPH